MTTLADARAIDSTPTRYLGSIEPRARAFDTIVLGGLTAGVLDILDAFAVSGLRGLGPTRVLHYIASGVLGPSASQGGMMTAALGFALHFVIALGAAATYLAASRKLPVLVRRPVVCGLGVRSRRVGLHALRCCAALAGARRRGGATADARDESARHPCAWGGSADCALCEPIRAALHESRNH